MPGSKMSISASDEPRGVSRQRSRAISFDSSPIVQRTRPCRDHRFAASARDPLPTSNRFACIRRTTKGSQSDWMCIGVQELSRSDNSGW